MHGEEALPSRPLHPSSSRTAREFWASRLDPGQVSTGKPSPMERSSGSQDFKSCVSQMSNINSEVPPPLPYLRSPRDRATSASGVDELPPPKKGKGKAKAEETTRTSVKKRGLWNKEEDALLVKMVEKYGAKDWSKIAAVLPGHTSKSCRLRWWNQLNPGIHRVYSPRVDILFVSHL